MIDITLEITIDEDHEDYFEEIMQHIASTPGICKVDIKTETYHEYNIDSTPHYEVEFEEISHQEFQRRLNLWIKDKYDGADYMLINSVDYTAVDNSSNAFLTECFKTREQAIAWLNGEEIEDDHYTRED